MRKYMHREVDDTFVVRGVADKGLEGDVKYAVEKNGVTVGDSVWVVHAGRDPSGDKTFGLVMMGVGIVVAGTEIGLVDFLEGEMTRTLPTERVEFKKSRKRKNRRELASLMRTEN